MKFIIGKKIGMTQKYQDNGNAIPVTKVCIEPCVVTQAKTSERDGYYSIQLGCGKSKHVNKPMQGHLKDTKASFLKEFRIKENEKDAFKVGDCITISSFVPGDMVKVTGFSKGRGFQGVVKRHGFSGQPSTHGHKDQSRMPGASGAGGKQHVFLGKRMPGRMGGGQVTVQNLEVIEVDDKNNFLYVKGAIPGSINSMIWLEGEGEMKMKQEIKTSEAANVEVKPIDQPKKEDNTLTPDN